MNGTYTTSERDPWSSMLMVVRVTVGHGSAGDVVRVVVRAKPLTEPTHEDAVRLKAIY
jgi:hypothetical protein